MENLYFIALIPSIKLCNEITAFKTDFSSRFDSSQALKVMPHITLKAPFKLPDSMHISLREWFKKLRVTREPFEIILKNFGAFYNKNSPVIFVHPVMTTPLYILQRDIITAFKIEFPTIPVISLEMTFKPHITIAYRDLKPAKFREAWEEYKQKPYESKFEVNSFHLLQHDRTRWNIIDTYSLLK